MGIKCLENFALSYRFPTCTKFKFSPSETIELMADENSGEVMALPALQAPTALPY